MLKAYVFDEVMQGGPRPLVVSGDVDYIMVTTDTLTQLSMVDAVLEIEETSRNIKFKYAFG